MQLLDKLYNLDKSVSTPLDDSVEIRHSGLRRLVQAVVDETSVRHVADLIGVSHGTLHQFVRYGKVSEKTLRKIERWRESLSAEIEIGPGAPLMEEGVESVVTPNYTDLGIDLPGYERLHDRPRGTFDRFMVELFKMGAGREALEFFGRTLLAPVMQVNMLHKGRHDADTSTEEDQTRIMDRMIPTLLEMAKEQLR